MKVAKSATSIVVVLVIVISMSLVGTVYADEGSSSPAVDAPSAAQTSGASGTNESISLLGENATVGEDVNATVGENVTLLVVTNATGVASYQTNLTYNESVLRIVNISGADFPTPVQNVNNTNGWAKFAQALSEGMDNATLAEVTFQVVATENTTTTVSFNQNGTMVFDENGAMIPIERFDNSTITVRTIE